jgi:hypothetical protein
MLKFKRAICVSLVVLAVCSFPATANACLFGLFGCWGGCGWGGGWCGGGWGGCGYSSCGYGGYGYGGCGYGYGGYGGRYGGYGYGGYGCGCGYSSLGYGYGSYHASSVVPSVSLASASRMVHATCSTPDPAWLAVATISVAPAPTCCAPTPASQSPAVQYALRSVSPSGSVVAATPQRSQISTTASTVSVIRVNKSS